MHSAPYKAQAGNTGRACKKSKDACNTLLLALKYLGQDCWVLSPIPRFCYNYTPHSKEKGNVLTPCKLNEAKNDDQSQCQQFCRSKGILNTSSSFHTVTVHCCEEHWKKRTRRDTSAFSKTNYDKLVFAFHQNLNKCEVSLKKKATNTFHEVHECNYMQWFQDLLSSDLTESRPFQYYTSHKQPSVTEDHILTSFSLKFRTLYSSSKICHIFSNKFQVLSCFVWDLK